MSSRRKTLSIIWLLVTLTILSAPAHPQTPAITSDKADQCNVKVALTTPGLNHPPEPPVGRIKIMGTRYRDLDNAITGYEKSGLPLISYDGHVFGPAGPVDDFGAYYFIPQVGVRFGFPLRLSIDVFYLTVLAAAVVLGAVGCCLALRTLTGKIFAIVELLLLAALVYNCGDVYVLLASTIIAIVPLALYVSEVPRVAIAASFAFASGMVISVANAIRSHSGTGVLAFLVCLVLSRFDGGYYRKLVIIVLLFSGAAMPDLYFTHLLRQRDAFLKVTCPDYPHVSERHIFWHAAYLGFGYLTNDDVAGYNDQVAFDKVQSISPGTLYGSPTYERILRQQVWWLIRRRPKLVLYTVAAKLGVICSLFLLSANIGLIAARRSRKPIGLELAFWVGIVFDALFGVLAVPVVAYLLGFITFAVLYGVVSLDFVLQSKVYKKAQQEVAIAGSG